MPRIIVSDASCIILFSKIGKLDILKSLFHNLVITDIIAKEYSQKLPDFIQVKNPKNKKYQQILETFLDKGEASAIALAFEEDDSLLIIDESKGRREAKRLGINITGSLGLIITAKEKGIISSTSEIIELIQKTNFRISESLILKALEISGE